MTPAIDPQQLRALARTILTPRQFECWQLMRYHSRTSRTVALMLDLDESTVRGHVRRAEQKLVLAVRHNAADGDIRATAVRPGPDGARAGEGLAA